jgi:DUF1009 family protein
VTKVPDNRQVVGLIAGYGRPPALVADGVHKAGKRLVIVGLSGSASPRLKGLADDFVWGSPFRMGRWIRALRRRGVKEAVMIGGIRKRLMYSRLRLLRYIPDIRTAWLWYHRIRKDRRDNAILLAVTDELRRDGIELVSCAKYCMDQMADEGLMTQTAVDGKLQVDVEFGWRIARASANLDIGQAIAVKELGIIAVEAIEGTDAMIRRAGRLCRVGGWTLVKVARPKQDMRFDVPTVGPNTIRNLADARCVCLVVEAGRTMIVDKPATLALADKFHIAVIGKKADSAAQ